MSKQKHFYLIRGLVREEGHWGPFLERLRQAFPDAIISCLDIPGAGEHHASPAPLSIKKMLEQMHRKYLLLKQPEESGIMVAISLGAMVGAAWLQEYPEDFDFAFFINTSFGKISAIHERLRPGAFFHLAQVIWKEDQEREAHILRLVCNLPLNYETNLDLYTEVFRQRPVTLLNTFRQLYAAFNFAAPSEAPRARVILLASRYDRMVDVSCSERIRDLWKVPLFIHPEAGHELTDDDPDWVIARMKESLD